MERIGTTYHPLIHSHLLEDTAEKSMTINLKVTRRELEVLFLIVNGYSNKEIAEKLFISDHTVITHRKHLIEKFKARNTAQMVKKACQVYSFD